MPTTNIPLEEWATFFNLFSRQHEGWLVNVEIIGGVVGAAPEAHEMLLAGISADVRDRNRAIAILLNNRGGGRITHVISEPRSVRLKRTAEGADEALAVESAEGVITLVRFRTAMLSERLNHVLD